MSCEESKVDYEFSDVNVEEQTPLEEINKIDDHAYANYPTKMDPNAQGAIWSYVILSSSHLEESVNLIRKVVPKDVRETQSFNEVWLEVQVRFIQDHQLLVELSNKLLN